MNLKYAQYIRTILREGSLTAASRVLYISQPALSQAIRQVELEMGMPVFERYKPQPLLTSAGEMYLEAARETQLIEMNLRNRLNEQKKEVHATLRFGISAQRGAQLLPHVMPRYIRKYPYVRIELVEFGSHTLEQMVKDGECDIALATTEPHFSQLEYVLLENEQLVLMASEETELAQHFADGTPIALEQAADERFVVLRPGHSVRSVQDHIFTLSRFNPKVLLESNNFATALNVAAYTPAVMLCPYVYVASMPAVRQRVKCYPIDSRGYERHFYLCYRKEMYFAQYMRDLRAIIEDTLRMNAMSCPMPAEGGDVP